MFEIFSPPRPFGKISFLANFIEVYFVGLNVYFWCPKVRSMLKNTCRHILEDSSFLRFLRFLFHHGPLGKSHFWQILWKNVLLVEMHIFGVLRSGGCLKALLGAFWKIEVFWDVWDFFATTALWENLIFGKFYRSVFCWSKCIFLVS